MRPGRSLFYLLALFFLLLGVISGALAVNVLPGDLRAETVDTMEGAVYTWRGGEGSWEQGLLRQSASIHLKTGGIIWIAGLTVVGIPLVALILFMRGFALGFTAGALVYGHGTGGLVLGLAALFPPNLFLIPALCLLGGQGFYLALSRYLGERGWSGGLREHLLAHLAAGAVALALIGLGSLAEGAVVPVFLSWIMPLLGRG